MRILDTKDVMFVLSNATIGMIEDSLTIPIGTIKTIDMPISKMTTRSINQEIDCFTPGL
jgi:hypothetical protein